MYCAWCGTPVPTVSYTLCSNCGKPTNGARAIPAPQAPSSGGGTNVAVVVIAVVVGGLFIVAVVGILAAIAIPNLLTATQRSKQKRTMADIRTIATAVEAYATDNNAYPRVTTVSALRPLLEPKYVRSLPLRDGWTAEIRYECVEEKDGVCAGYAVGSGGKDMHFEHDALRDYLDGKQPTTNFDCDIVYANGEFVQYPEGVQGGGR
jgi:general secretion pathway protein G